MTLGVDVSHWQGEMNWPAAHAAGAEFAYIRSSILHAEDEFFQRNADLCDLPRGFYHFLSEYGDPEDQADIFCDLIENLRWELRPVVDCESHTNPDDILMFISAVEDRLGVRPMIYTGAWWWNPNVGDQPLYAAYPLWIALWTNSVTDPLVIEPCPPWTTWLVHQFSAQGNGRGAEFGAQSQDIDLNRFYGDLDAEIAAVHAERYGADLEARVSAVEADVSDLRASLVGIFSGAADIVGS